MFQYPFVCIKYYIIKKKRNFPAHQKKAHDICLNNVPNQMNFILVLYSKTGIGSKGQIEVLKI